MYLPGGSDTNQHALSYSSDYAAPFHKFDENVDSNFNITLLTNREKDKQTKLKT